LRGAALAPSQKVGQRNGNSWPIWRIRRIDATASSER
jgi:hypothetical protein